MPTASIARPSPVFLAASVLTLFCALTASAGESLPALTRPGSPKQIDFERHIMGLLGRQGCNAGSCHGSFQGKGGFRLSLFGYDPDLDYQSITRDIQGRRINPTDPDSSLLLLKATGSIEHGGMRRFARGSWQYRMIRDWIAAGMPRNRGSGTVKSITVTPSEYAFTGASEKGQLTVKAVFAEGDEEDITSLCDFRTNDEMVATVGSMGEVVARQAGDTAIIVS